MVIIDITGNKGWIFLISQEITKMHGYYWYHKKSQKKNAWVLLISHEIRYGYYWYHKK